MQKKDDRRVRYTKALLRDALVELMQTRHISKISVKALCEAADVHRSTFYVHYADPYDLLSSVTQETLSNVTSYLDEQDFDLRNPLSVQKLDKILQYAQAHADVFRALLSKNSEASIQSRLLAFISSESFPISPGLEKDAKLHDYISLFAINGCISVVNKWMQDGMVEPTQVIAQFLTKVLYQGIGSIKEMAQQANTP